MAELLRNQYRCFFSSLLLLGLCLSPFRLVRAQLQIQFPVSRLVFQRNLANQSTFPVSGTCPVTADRVEARLTPLQPNQGTPLDWTLLDAHPAQGQFNGVLTALGGWYQLDVRASQQGVVVAMGSVDRVGIGEVFLVAGQSNAQGLLGLGAVGATDDRINCINRDNTQNDTTHLPQPPVFSPVVAETFIGPKGHSAWCWGRLGDLLVGRLNVPVLFYNVASAGTTIKNWRESAEGKPTLYTFGDLLPAGMPYNQFKRVLTDYIAQTGVRAVLWHQGEAEPYDTTRGQPLPAYPTNYTRDLNWLINRSRQETGLNLSWVVSRASINNVIADLIHANSYQPVIDAQNQVIQTTANVFAGPETDGIQFPRTALGEGVHFTDGGLIDLANAWNATLTDQFFAGSTPVMPPAMQLVDLQLAMRVDKRVSAINQPQTFSVLIANQGSNAAPQVSITNTLPPNLAFVGSAYFTNNQGTLSATIPVVEAGQTMVLTYQAVPLVAGTYMNAAEVSSCGLADVDSHPGSDVADGEDDAGWVDFRTTEPGDDLFRTPIRPTTPAPPTVLSNQPAPNPTLADLNLRVVASNLTVAVGQFWSLTLIVDNRGGATAQNVQLGCVLPVGITFYDSPNMGFSSGTIRGSLVSIPAGGSGALWFTAIPMQPGPALSSAQIEAATPGDPDSTPNNGFTNGEDDTAQCLIRVR